MASKKSKNKLVARTKKVAVQPEVSQNCDTLGWRFKVYVSSAGNAEVQKAINGKDEEWMQHFKVRIKYLANTPKRDWKKPYALKLQKVTDIYEIRFQANGVQQRPFGYFGPRDKEFTILILATHKEKIYDPNDAIKTAESRRKYIQDGRASCVPLTIDGEEFPCAEES